MLQYRQVPGTVQRAPRRAGWWTVFLVMALAMMPVMPVSAAPSAQAPEAANLVLGQYGFAEMVEDDVRAWVIEIPEDGVYLITAVDDAAAEDFDIVVTDAAGTVLLDDVFETTEIELPAGPVTLEFYAVADNTLAFVVLGQFGSMSTNEAQPGKLVPGGVYLGENMDEAHFGQFTIAPTAYPQQVLVYVEAGEGDTFYGTVEGEGVYDYLTTSEDNLMSFWTHGGDYQLYLDPYDRRSSVTVIIFLAGPPRPLTVGEEFNGSLPAGATEVVYALPLAATYSELTIETDFDGEVEVMLFDRYRDGTINYSSYGDATLELTDIYAGSYYVMLRVYEPAAEARTFTLLVDGEAGRPIVPLTPGEALLDEIAEGEDLLVYSFEVVQAGALVTVRMDGPTDRDFDMYVGMRPGVNLWSRYTFNSTEEVVFMAPVAGTYFVGVMSNGNTGEFTLLAEEGDLAPALESNRQTVGVLQPGRTQIYRLETTRVGQMVTVLMVGGSDADIDVRVQGYDATGGSIFYAGGFRYGSVEAAADVVSTPGVYEVTVTVYSTADDRPITYFLQADVRDPAVFARQWAVDAVAGSQYGDDGYSARQATGEPDTLVAGDRPTAWATQNADDGLQTLELTYAHAVVPGGINIVESYNPGALVLIEAYDADGDAWVVLWEGEAGPVDEDYRIFSPALASPDFATDRIRLTLDTDAVSGWNEIEAVELLGRP